MTTRSIRIGRVGGLTVALLVAAATLAACSGGSPNAPVGSIEISGAWAKASTKIPNAATAFALITNAGTAADALIGAETSAGAKVEINETYAIEGPAASDGMEMGGPAATSSAPAVASPASPSASPALAMRPIERLEIPASGSVELKPGGYHLMLTDLKQDLKAGDKIELTLIFEKAGRVRITAEARAK